MAFGNKKNDGSKNDNSKKGNMFGKAKKSKKEDEEKYILEEGEENLVIDDDMLENEDDDFDAIGNIEDLENDDEFEDYDEDDGFAAFEKLGRNKEDTENFDEEDNGEGLDFKDVDGFEDKGVAEIEEDDELGLDDEEDVEDDEDEEVDEDEYEEEDDEDEDEVDEDEYEEEDDDEDEEVDEDEYEEEDEVDEDEYEEEDEDDEEVDEDEYEEEDEEEDEVDEDEYEEEEDEDDDEVDEDEYEEEDDEDEDEVDEDEYEEEDEEEDEVDEDEYEEDEDEYEEEDEEEDEVDEDEYEEEDEEDEEVDEDEYEEEDEEDEDEVDEDEFEEEDEEEDEVDEDEFEEVDDGEDKTDEEDEDVEDDDEDETDEVEFEEIDEVEIDEDNPVEVVEDKADVEEPKEESEEVEKTVEENSEVKGKKEDKSNAEYENITLDEISDDEEVISEPLMDDDSIQELDEDTLEEVTEDEKVDNSVRKSKIKVKSPRDERKAIEQEDIDIEEKALEEYAASLPDVAEVELTEEEKERFINADEDAKSEAEEAYEAMYGVEEEEKVEEEEEEEEEVKESIYPEELVDLELECVFIGLLFNNPKAISRFYFLYEDCKFSDEELMNLYKIVLFRDGEAYAPAIAKEKYQLPRENPHTYDLKYKVRKIAASKDYDTEEVYTKLKKLFILKKYYMIAATRVLQDNILKIKDYELYKDMTVEEVKNAIDQLTVTTGLSQDVLNHNATQFLLEGDNELANGLRLPFEILTTVFKGIRKGETMCFAMPSNSGKSRFTINLASYIAFIHKQKVLVISNEMSVEKMKLCMITTILNNPEIQGLHGQPVRKTEGELLELKFRADNPKRIKCDEDGFIIKKDGETQEEYIAKLAKYSKEFKMTCAATDWLETQLNNSIYFIHITEHTNDDLKKVIMNYYYKEGIEYMFYDTLKADVANIGNSDEVKKTATILSNIAQKYKTFIASSMQLIESNTLPVNLTVNEMSASKTVKEVLDTLCLIKQISRHTLHKYEYAPTDQFDECHDIDVPKDTDVRFYACVVDKNRAGAKPTLLFRLNLAYNEWEELGHLRLKQTEDYDD